MNLKPLIWKELRENVKLLPIGVFICGVICWMSLPSANNSYLIATKLVNYLAIASPLLAFALGVVQAFRDLQPAARAYLTHRNVTESDVFLSKTIAGFLIYAAAIVVPLLVMASWIGIQGMDRFPMRPAQTIPACVLALAAFVLHPAAMMMMVRSASWWGTRLLPLVLAGGFQVPVVATLGTGGFKGAGICLPVALIALVWLIATARQTWIAYVDDPTSLRLANPARRRWLLPSYLLICVVIVALSAAGFTIALTEEMLRPSIRGPYQYSRVAIDEDTGQAWFVTFQQEYVQSKGEYKNTTIGGELIGSGAPINPLTPLVHDRHFLEMNYLYPSTWPSGWGRGDGFFTESGYDSRGFVLHYSLIPERHWQRTTAADGIIPPGKFTGERFTNDPINCGAGVFRFLSQAGYSTPWVDGHGVYFTTEDPPSIRKEIDVQVDTAMMIYRKSGQTPRLFICSSGELLEYKFIDPTGSESWFETPDPESRIRRNQNLNGLKLTAELVGTTKLPAELLTESLLPFMPTDNGFVFISPHNPQAIIELSSNGDHREIAYKVVPGTTSPRSNETDLVGVIVIGFIPTALLVGGLVVFFWEAATKSGSLGLLETLNAYPTQTTFAVLSFLLATIASYAWVRYMARRRGLSRGQTIVWCWSLPFLGLIAPLAMVAIYRIVIREPCLQCSKPRRVDDESCIHCNAPWQPPANTGIEITDREEAASALSANLAPFSP